MMNWLILLAVIVGILVILTVIGLVKNIIRTGIAVIVGYIVAIGLSYCTQALGFEGIPDIVWIIVGGVAGFFTLLRMKR